MTEGTGTDDLSGIRILIVEDEGAIALMLEDMLFDMGCEVVGTAARIAKAMALIENTAMDIAILDLNIAGETAYPLAEELAKRGVGFIFSTGYGALDPDRGFEDAIILPKPFTQRDLKARLIEANIRRTGS